MAFVTALTRGGQVHLHQLRMLKQVVVTVIVLSFLLGFSHLAYNLSRQIPLDAWRVSYEYVTAELILSTLTPDKQYEATQNYIPLRGTPYKRKCIHIIKDPYIKRTVDIVRSHVKQHIIKSLWFSLWYFLVISFGWIFYGVIHQRSKHHRGSTFSSWKNLRRQLKWSFRASDLKLGKLPLIKDKETSHILISGTTGSGKSNTFHLLIPQIKQREDKAIIVDVTGDYVSRYYDEKTDIILNPFDTRSKSWTPWSDIELDHHYDIFAEALIPSKEGRSDPFWDNASKAILKTALRKYAALQNNNIEDFYNFLMTSNEREFDEFFKGTEAATFSSKDNEKTTGSIRSSLSSQIECLRHLETSIETFSIRDWIQDDAQKGWLFLTSRPDQRQTLRPLISAWVDTAISALMILPENKQRRIWFIIDELASLQNLPRLQTGLAEARKYGGCILVGFQSKPQLDAIYGREMNEAMLDLFNTKIFFRSTEPSTQNWISKVLGEKEEEEATENVSYGANTIRDGVSLGRQKRTKPLIMPTELSQLRDLECYVKLPGNYPITKYQTQYQVFPERNVESFILKVPKIFKLNGLVTANARVDKEKGSMRIAVLKKREEV